jgi:hypothetical protein
MIVMNRRDFANGDETSSSLPLVGAGVGKDNPYVTATFTNGRVGSIKRRSFDAASNPLAAASLGHARMSSLDNRDMNKFTASNSTTDIDDDPNDIYCTPAHSVGHSTTHSRQPSDESANYARNYMRLHQQLSVIADSAIVIKHQNSNNINGKVDSISDMHKV